MRVLVLAPQGLGDSLEATPLLARLRDGLPAATIDVVVMRPAAVALFSGLTSIVDRVVYLPYWERGSFAFLEKTAAALWSTPRYDLSFTVYPAARREYHILAALFRARRRVGHAYGPRSIGGALWAYTDLVPIGTSHNVDRNLELADAAGIGGMAPKRYEIPAAWRRAAIHPRRIALHAGSIDHDGFALKRWPESHFIEIVRWLIDRGEEPWLIGGLDEKDLTERIVRSAPGVSVFAGSLPDLAEFLSSCRLLISNDSGVAHLAAGVNTPTITMFGPTPVTGAPWSRDGASAIALRPSLCPPCFDVQLGLRRGCVLNIDAACIRRDLTVGAVMEAVTLALGDEANATA